MSKGYSIPINAKIELFRSIFEARHPRFTYALLSESPTDTASIKNKPWTVLCVNFLMAEENSAVLNAILQHTPSEVEDIYKICKQIRNCLNEYDKQRTIFHGLKNLSKKLKLKDQKVRKDETKRKRCMDSSSETESEETRKKVKTVRKTTDDVGVDDPPSHNPFTDDELDVSDDSYYDNDYVPKVEEEGEVEAMID